MTRIQLRRDTAANWTTANSILAQGEIGLETDTDKLKIGDGSTAWTSLGYFVGSPGATGAAGATPTTILSGITFTVPPNSQALMRRRILVDTGGHITIGTNSVLISS